MPKFPKSVLLDFVDTPETLQYALPQVRKHEETLSKTDSPTKGCPNHMSRFLCS